MGVTGKLAEIIQSISLWWLKPQKQNEICFCFAMYRFLLSVSSLIRWHEQRLTLIIMSFPWQDCAAFPNPRQTFQTLLTGMILLCSLTLWLGNLKTFTTVENERRLQFPVWPKLRICDRTIQGLFEKWDAFSFLLFPLQLKLELILY